MAGYLIQKKNTDGTMSDIPLVATYDSSGNNIVDTYIPKASSSTDNAIVRFNGTGGKSVQNSKVTIDDSGNMVFADSATAKFSMYGTRFVTISGNSISADMSGVDGGWAGAFASVTHKSTTSETGKATTTMLGWYGGNSGLTHIFMGGSYSDPAMKMTPAGVFTFKNTITASISGNAGTATKATMADNAEKLDSQDGSYYLNYNNFTNKPDLTKYVEKVSGKGLSTNDYTTAEKNKLGKAVTTDGTETITADKTTTGVFKIQNGSASGALVLGADSQAKTLTANNRKLGRMGIPSYDSNGSKTVAGISFDAQASTNYADFGGHPLNSSSIAPDVIRFTVADTHNNTVNGARTLALQIAKQNNLTDSVSSSVPKSFAGAEFFVPVKVGGNLSATSITENGTALSSKYVAQVSGKGLSTNDYTTAEKNSLATLTNLLGTDSDAVVNRITEMLDVFEEYPEGTTIVDTLALKSNKTHTHSYTPSGTVSKPSFTGTKATISTKYTPSGTVTASLSATPTFTGSSATSGAPSATTSVGSSTHTHTYDKVTSITISKGTGTANYTPSGTVSKPTFSGTSDNTTIADASVGVGSMTGVGTLPSLTTTYTESTQTLAFSFSKGTLPTKETVSVATGTHVHGFTPSGTVSQPTFTGTGAQLVATPTTTSTASGAPSGTVKVGSETHTHSVTAKGSVSKPSITASFSGTEATISTEYTPAGSVSQPTFTGTAKNTGTASE